MRGKPALQWTRCQLGLGRRQYLKAASLYRKMAQAEKTLCFVNLRLSRHKRTYSVNVCCGLHWVPRGRGRRLVAQHRSSLTPSYIKRCCIGVPRGTKQGLGLNLGACCAYSESNFCLLCHSSRAQAMNTRIWACAPNQHRKMLGDILWGNHSVWNIVCEHS